MQSRLIARIPVAGVALAGCGADESGCGGGTCPFGVVGRATVRGRVIRADGTAFIGTTSSGVLVSCPDASGGFRVPTDAGGAYELEVAALALPAGDAVACELAAGVPVFAAETALVAFSRDQGRRAVTVVDIQERARR